MPFVRMPLCKTPPVPHANKAEECLNLVVAPQADEVLTGGKVNSMLAETPECPHCTSMNKALENEPSHFSTNVPNSALAPQAVENDF